MKNRNIIVIGASAGGFDAIKEVVARLPADLNAAVFIVWHLSPETTGILPDVLNKLNTLPTANARDWEDIKMGHIYVAPPDRHMLLEADHIRVTKGPKENRFRPAVDPLFRSAAYVFGPRVIGVVLSGALDDGTAGLWTIKERGGITMVQDPREAVVPAMPFNALREVNIDFNLPVAAIGKTLGELTVEPLKEVKYKNTEENKKTELELHIAMQDDQNSRVLFELGELSPFTCPECSGVLAAITDGRRVRYRCHTGHAFSADSLLASLTEKTEQTLWNAVKDIQETAMLLNHVGDHFAENNHPHEAALYFQKAKESLMRSQTIKSVLLEHEKVSVESIETFNDKEGVDKLAG
ncbi:chemotaxis protein CheB [Longitalea arenae]|uniref:chemotaxis protein CheB n=1 Tax=Longitalea arenae TaxID=2812558 RepID=UPI00196706E4|nr:chemotaxis protein CheB [Longitalea arenae]